MNIRRGEVHEVVSFYSFLQVPVDVVRVCTGPGVRLHGRASATGALAVAASATATSRRCGCRATRSSAASRTAPTVLADEPDELAEPPELSQDEVLARLEAAGLTGMGGAGFPTFRKWAAVRAEPAPRAVIVNADEGEPGTIKDRYVMELRPQLLLEGLESAMRFCEADRCVHLPARGVRDLARAAAGGDRRARA